MVGSVNSNYNLLPPSFFDPTTNALLVDETTAQQVQAGIQAKLDKLPPIADDAFLQMVADLVPGDVDTPQKLSATLDAFETAAANLGDAGSDVVIFVGDISKMLARLMIETLADQRKNALNDRLAAREQAKADLMNQATEMDEAAEKMIQGAMTSLITGLVASSIQFIGAVANLGGAIKALKPMGEAQKATKEALQGLENAQKVASHVTTEADKAAANLAVKMQETAAKMAEQMFSKGQTTSQLFQAIGQVGQSLGEGTRTGGTSTDTRLQAEAKKDEAEGSRDAAMSQEAQQIADNKKQMEESLNDMIKQIINFLKEVREAEVDAMRALTRV